MQSGKIPEKKKPFNLKYQAQKIRNPGLFLVVKEKLLFHRIHVFLYTNISEVKINEQYVIINQNKMIIGKEENWY
jgi:hypothetical protein